MIVLNDIKGILTHEYHIDFGEELLDGHMGVPIFRAKRNNEEIVVKIGFGSDTAIQEVKRNIDGYKAMIEIGATGIMPGQLQIIELFGYPVIMMKDLGLTFKDQSKIDSNPQRLFQNLAIGLKEVYKETLVSGEQKNRGYEFLEEMKACLQRQYLNYLLPRNLIGAQDLRLSQMIEIGDCDTGKFCFGVWDFTPEDVFVKGGKVYYIDPPPKVLGIPIIDIACFAGVARDVYYLPASQEGYHLLYLCAVREVAQLLDLTLKQAEKIFFLGRAIQCSLSARFRISENLELAQLFAKQSVEYLRRIKEY